MLTQIKSDLASALSPLLELDASALQVLLESPKKSEHGHLSLPVFQFAKTLKKAPPLVATEFADRIRGHMPPYVEAVTVLSGFINFQFSERALSGWVKSGLIEAKSPLGEQSLGAGKKVVIDFSSPNVAKPMSIGHLRATVIGQAICNLARTQGYTVVGLNHLGDWGTQFGKLVWAYREWGSEYDFETKAFESLYALYVRFHDEAEKNSLLNEKGAAAFRELEAGSSEVTKLWRWFVDISLIEYQRLWDLLGVKHDLIRGESFYNDRLKPTEKMLLDLGLLKESDGAMVVEMDDPKLPPCLIMKSDGASLYATRDIASALYRKNELSADINLYVVGVDQTLHFRQVFEVIKKMGHAWAKDCHHISFGMYRFKDIGKMSSRRGKIIVFEDVIRRAIEMVEEIIEQKNPALLNKKAVAEQVGVGAIIFNDLVNDRVKDVDFEWERVIDFEGNSGPFVQYCNVRCKSVLRKAAPADLGQGFLTPLLEAEELQLMWALLGFEKVLEDSYRMFKPHVLANYLLEIGRLFSSFYAKCKILNGEEGVRQSRLTLVQATSLVLEKGLQVLNIPCPSEM
jgi:arginyl-tRNA synthetase